MIRTNITKLREPRWFKPFEDDEIEVQLVPGAAAELQKEYFGDGGLCREAFIGFRKYWTTDSGEIPVENNLAMRLELLDWNNLRNTIRLKLVEWNEAIARGEDLDG